MAADDGRVVSNFIVQALKNEDITVYGTGQQTRSFCYVDDLITGMIKLMESDDAVTGPINMGNPGEFTMLELAEKVIKFTNTTSKIVHKDLPGDDPQQRRPDITVAKSLLNWEPMFDLDEGLKRTIRYFEDVLRKDNIGS
jgi:UDP-glucuronate decarboxylase